MESVQEVDSVNFQAVRTEHGRIKNAKNMEVRISVYLKDARRTVRAADCASRTVVVLDAKRRVVFVLLSRKACANRMVAGSTVPWTDVTRKLI